METRIVHIKQIFVPPERGRVDFKRIEELRDSLKANGFIHPILVTECEHTVEIDGQTLPQYQLIAGERRYRAALVGGFKELPVTFREGLDFLTQKVLELEENVGRVDLSWQEEASINAQIDELKRKLDPNWTQAQTAELTNLSAPQISRQITLHKALKADPKLAEEIKAKKFDMNTATKYIKQKEEAARAERLQASGRLVLSDDLRLGDCRTLIKKLPDASVDLWLTDPPYGSEGIEILRTAGMDSFVGHKLISDDHNMTIEAVLSMLRELAPELYRVLKPGAHFYCFCEYQHMGEFIKALAPLEFKPPCLHWLKNKASTKALGYNYMSMMECIIYGFKPPMSKRLAKNSGNVLSFSEVPRNLRVYPTEKPQDLLGFLINQSTNIGDTVLDTFAGSASTLKAARATSRNSIGFEVNREAFMRAQAILQGREIPPDASPDQAD